MPLFQRAARPCLRTRPAEEYGGGVEPRMAIASTGRSPSAESQGLVVVFQARSEFDRARRALDAAGARARVIEPPPEVADVAAPCLLVSDASAREALHAAVKGGLLVAGQVWYREPLLSSGDRKVAVVGGYGGLPPAARTAGDEDAVGRIAIVLVAPCIAEEDDLRLAAHVEGDLAPVMPYLNAVLRAGTFNPGLPESSAAPQAQTNGLCGPTFTFMDAFRLINLFPHRIVIGRLREIQDAWRTLKAVKNTINDAWSRRASIVPCHERRVRLSALEIFTRLPRTNCRLCGEATCLAFAAKVLSGEQRLAACAPVFGGGEYGRLRPALADLAAGLGL